ncbi:MAG: MCP four helix bundle domain-containing protein [Saprospiraceae bacterium]|nr:MCP four helix bundle domain-containing protein [Saprospiraceae bacterium]
MKWAYAIKSKMKVSVLLAVVMIIVMINNLVERKQIKSLKNDFKEIYQDRLLVESYIFQLYDHLYRKLEMLEAHPYSEKDQAWYEQLDQHQDAISDLTNRYRETLLTVEEEKHFGTLQDRLKRLHTAENALLQEGVDQNTDYDITAVHTLTGECFVHLASLSEIQVVEGQVLRKRSSKTLMGSISTSHFEMSVLIFIALMIQVLILTGKPITTFKQNPGLN